MVTLDNYQELLRKVERLRAKHDQAVGAKKEILKRLKKEFGVSSLKEAIVKLEKLKDEEIEAARRYEHAKSKFETKWRKQLKEL